MIGKCAILGNRAAAHGLVVVHSNGIHLDCVWNASQSKEEEVDVTSRSAQLLIQRGASRGFLLASLNPCSSQERLVDSLYARVANVFNRVPLASILYLFTNRNMCGHCAYSVMPRMLFPQRFITSVGGTDVASWDMLTACLGGRSLDDLDVANGTWRVWP